MVEVKLYWDQHGKEHAIKSPGEEVAALKAGWIDHPGVAPELSPAEVIAPEPLPAEVPSTEAEVIH